MDKIEQFKMACQNHISGPDYEVVLKTESLKVNYIYNGCLKLILQPVAHCASFSWVG